MTIDPTRPASMDVLDGASTPGRTSEQRVVLAQPTTTAVRAPKYHDTGGGDRAPATPVEQILADIYAQVLGLNHVGVDESFFDLGGDSLSAMRVIAAINTALGTDLALSTLFDTPSIASLSQQLGQLGGQASSTCRHSVSRRGQLGRRSFRVR